MGELYPCEMKKTIFHDDWRQYQLPFDSSNTLTTVRECRSPYIIDFIKAKARIKTEERGGKNNIPRVS